MSEPQEFRVFHVIFNPEGIEIAYGTSTDVRVSGYLMRQQVLSLSAGHADYRDDIEALQDRAQRALKNALEDFESSEPWLGDDADDDEQRGMGE